MFFFCFSGKHVTSDLFFFNSEHERDNVNYLSLTCSVCKHINQIKWWWMIIQGKHQTVFRWTQNGISSFVLSRPWPLSIPPNAPPLRDALVALVIYMVQNFTRFVGATASLVVCLLFLKEAARGTELEITLQCFIPVILDQISGMIQEFDVLEPKSKGLR